MGRIYNIGSAENFAHSLAAGILQRFEAIENITIYLPSRRAIKTLSEAFLSVSGKPAMLLPNMQAIGDIDDDELEISPKFEALNKGAAVISKTARLLEMAKLLAEPGRKFTQNMLLAKSLITLIDEMQNNGVSWESFESVVPEEFASHWQVTLDFLQKASRKWQEKLEAEGRVEPVLHRNNIINTLADFYEANPPAHPVIIAGSTGSVNATANFISRLSKLPNGYVVLFGLDKNLDDSDHEQLEETHPQFLLSRLLLKLNTKISDVDDWQSSAATKRQQLISASLFPTHKTTSWQSLNLECDIELAEFNHIENEATAIALMLRQVLESELQTAMVVTNNRSLARRIAAKMKIWNVNINDSAGQPLLNTVSANFLILLAEVFAQRQAPVDVLAFFKHPYIPQKIKNSVREHEVENYHKPRSLTPPLLPAAFNYSAFEALFEPISVNLKQLLTQHLLLAESIADELWKHNGADLKDLINEMLEEIDDAFEIDPLIYPEFLRIIFSTKTFRPKFGQHERINIFSPIEARLQNADVIIMADMNEGSFPQLAGADSFTNQKIRRSVGLDLPQKKIGQNAHDYELLCQNPKIILTRSTKINGSPTTKSRFLQRLQAVTNFAPTNIYASWVQQFYTPDKFITLARPAPKPPVAARPTKLSATKISKLIRDPYTIYAEKVLRLRKIDEVDRELSAADFGNFIHNAFEEFGKIYDGKLETLLKEGERLFEQYGNFVGAKAFWWNKFKRIAEKFIMLEQQRRCGYPIILEETGELKIGGFTLTAKADRIENCPDGLKIIDYKTGEPPTAKHVEQGLEPQLAIEAIIFEKLYGKPAISLEYWHLKGKDEIIKIHQRNLTAIACARENIPQIIAKMQDEATPFIARPWSYYALAYNDYEHLERIKEWS